LGLEFFCHWLPGADAPGYFMPLLRSFFIAKRLAKRGVFVPFSAGVWYGFSIAGARCLGSLYFMSGHSKWSKIKRQKGVSDAKKAKVFAKLAREIGIAVRLGGPEADLNPRLRMILLKCRSANMPADNIDRAIKRAAGDDDDAHFEELTYEIFVSGGVAVLAHAHTDNRNRSAADIRHIVTKAGGQFASAGAVTRLFERKGQIIIERADADEDTLMELALEAGAEDFTADENGYEIVTGPNDFEQVHKAVEEKGIATLSAEMTSIALQTTAVDDSGAATVTRLVDALEENDDVSDVFTNADFPEDA